MSSILRSSKTRFTQGRLFYTQGPLFCALGPLFYALVREEDTFAVCKRCANEGFACMCKEKYIFPTFLRQKVVYFTYVYIFYILYIFFHVFRKINRKLLLLYTNENVPLAHALPIPYTSKLATLIKNIALLWYRHGSSNIASVMAILSITFVPNFKKNYRSSVLRK